MTSLRYSSNLEFVLLFLLLFANWRPATTPAAAPAVNTTPTPPDHSLPWLPQCLPVLQTLCCCLGIVVGVISLLKTRKGLILVTARLVAVIGLAVGVFCGGVAALLVAVNAVELYGLGNLPFGRSTFLIVGVIFGGLLSWATKSIIAIAKALLLNKKNPPEPEYVI